MMEEKKGLVDFLRSAVPCFKDLPRGHIINLAQHMQMVLPLPHHALLAHHAYLAYMLTMFSTSPRNLRLF